jgi:DNA-binding NarL/FixJ family response regulator
LHDLHSDYVDVRLPNIVEQVLELIDELDGPAKVKAKDILSELFLFGHELRKHTLFEERMLSDLSDGSRLTEREQEVLSALVRGLSNKEVADKLNISTHTAISHRKNIMRKTGVRSLPELTLYAISLGLISP